MRQRDDVDSSRLACLLAKKKRNEVSIEQASTKLQCATDNGNNNSGLHSTVTFSGNSSFTILLCTFVLCFSFVLPIAIPVGGGVMVGATTATIALIKH